MCTVLYNSADACHLPATNSIEHILRLTREGRDSSDRARTESKAQTCCVKSKENKLFTWTNIYINLQNSKQSTLIPKHPRHLAPGRECFKETTARTLPFTIDLDWKTLSPDLTLTELLSLWCLTKPQPFYHHFNVYTSATSWMHATKHNNRKKELEQRC